MNQEIVNRLDAHLYGSLPSGTPAVNSYWESVYHVQDDITKPSNARYRYMKEGFLYEAYKILWQLIYCLLDCDETMAKMTT